MPKGGTAKTGSSSSGGPGVASTTKTKSKILECIAQMPKLTQSNWSAWKRALEIIAYNEGWEREILDMKFEEKAEWDGNEEADDTISAARRVAFSVQRLSVSDDLKHLTVQVRIGDSRGMFKKLSGRFMRMTQGGIAALYSEFINYTQEQSGFSVEKYASTLLEKAEMLRSLGRNISANELVAALFKGILKPEFIAVITVLSMQPATVCTWDASIEAITNFALDHGCIDSRRGGNTKPVTNLTMKGGALSAAEKKKKPCRFHKMPAGCKFGDACSFSHAGPAASGHANSQRASNNSRPKGANPNNYPKGSCYECGSKDHIRPKCPKLKEKSESKDGNQPASEEKPARSFMMAVQPDQRPNQPIHVAATTSHAHALAQTLPHWQRDLMRWTLIIDSACTLHMCPVLCAFIQSTLEACNIDVVVGNGVTETCTLRGSFMVYPHGKDAFVVKNALYAPKCPYTILSEAAFIRARCSIEKFWWGNFRISFCDEKKNSDPEEILRGCLDDSDDLFHVSAELKRIRSVHALSIQHQADPFKDFTLDEMKNGLFLDPRQNLPQPLNEVVSIGDPLLTR
jgi:gag-polypeptide of LTR copia-type